MALKKKKLPKKPKASASLAVHENWFKRAKAVSDYNKKLESDKKKKEALRNKISGFKP